MLDYLLLPWLSWFWCHICEGTAILKAVETIPLGSRAIHKWVNVHLYSTWFSVCNCNQCYYWSWIEKNTTLWSSSLQTLTFLYGAPYAKFEFIAHPKSLFLPNLHKSMQLCFAPFDYRHLEEQLMERSLVQIETGIKPLSSVMSKLETLQFGHSSWPNSKSLFYSTPLVDDCVESSHLPD